MLLKDMPLCCDNHCFQINSYTGAGVRIFKIMYLVTYSAALIALMACASVANGEDSTPLRTKDDPEVFAPAWKVGQWWRIRKTNTLGQPPRMYLRRVAEVRENGYVVEIVDETTSTTSVSLVSKDINGITNSVEGYPKPQMVSETLPDNGMLQFPIKVGSRWERSYLLVSKGSTKLPASITGTADRVLDLDTKLPTIIRGAVDRAVDLDTPLGRLRTYQINLWWKSDGSVPYQATCMYQPDIGWCAEYRSGLETSRVIEVGNGK